MSQPMVWREALRSGYELSRGPHCSLSLWSSASLLVPTNGPEEPVWGVWLGHTACPTPPGLQLQKGRIWRGMADRVEQGRADPLNQPDQLSQRFRITESVMSQPAFISPFIVQTCHLRHLQSLLPMDSDSFIFIPSCIRWLNSKPRGSCCGLHSFLVLGYLLSPWSQLEAVRTFRTSLWSSGEQVTVQSSQMSQSQELG